MQVIKIFCKKVFLLVALLREEDVCSVSSRASSRSFKQELITKWRGFKMAQRYKMAPCVSEGENGEQQRVKP